MVTSRGKSSEQDRSPDVLPLTRNGGPPRPEIVRWWSTSDRAHHDGPVARPTPPELDEGRYPIGRRSQTSSSRKSTSGGTSSREWNYTIVRGSNGRYYGEPPKAIWMKHTDPRTASGVVVCRFTGRLYDGPMTSGILRSREFY